MSEDNENYSLIIMSNIDPERALPNDVFLKIDGKFVKFRGAGDSITSEKFNFFISKGLKSLYVKSEKIMSFLEWINDAKQEAEEIFSLKAGEENRSFFQRTEKVREKVFECFFEEELNSELIEKLQANVADFVEEISKNPITAEAISALTEKNNTIADHSVNVGSLAIYLAMSLGHGHQFVLENIYMGSIFHDYGKAKIPNELLEKGQKSEYYQALNDHPLAAVKILRKTEGIPEQVITIILEHHEQFNGRGYPKGIGGDNLYDLGQIVSIANIFDNSLNENLALSVKERNQKAIKVIADGMGKEWNSRFYPRVLEALKLAFK